jgi:glycine betaine/choline ABC-type transport system substrate-binding protein
VRKALTSGEIDIYPEYTGNAAFFFNKADDPVWKNASQGYDTAKKLDYSANHLVGSRRRRRTTRGASPCSRPSRRRSI